MGYAAAATSGFLDGGFADPVAGDLSVGNAVHNRNGLGFRCRTLADSKLIGVIGEVLVYSVQLDASARSRVRNYLAAKWGIPVTP